MAALMALANVRTQLKSIDASDCLELVKQFGEAQRRANNATEANVEREVRELLNLFEVTALLFNDGRLGRSSTYIARNALIDGWVWLETNDGMEAILREAITGPTTFQQLLLFKRRHLQPINNVVEKRRQNS